VTPPLGEEGLGRRMAGVRDLCPAVACVGGGEEGAAKGGRHTAEHRALLPEHRQGHGSDGADGPG